MKILHSIDNLQGVPKFIMLLSFISADLLALAACFVAYRGGREALILSRNMISTSVTMLSEGFALGLLWTMIGL